MHSIIKSMFYIIFITISLIAGIKLLIQSNGSQKARIFGLMILLLGLGESFHLIPRLILIFSENSDSISGLIATGRFIASLSIIFVYLILFKFWKVYYSKSSSNILNIALIILGVLGVIFSVLFMNKEDTLFIMLRNLPTIVIGILVVIQFKKQASTATIQPFKYLWLAFSLSLLFTLGFELLNVSYPFFIILMMPKTLMFIWIVLMGYFAERKGLLS